MPGGSAIAQHCILQLFRLSENLIQPTTKATLRGGCPETAHITEVPAEELRADQPGVGSNAGWLAYACMHGDPDGFC